MIDAHSHDPDEHRDKLNIRAWEDRLTTAANINIPWHAQHDELYAFAVHLVDDECFDAKELLSYLEKPWHWDDEYHVWKTITPIAEKLTPAEDVFGPVDLNKLKGGNFIEMLRKGDNGIRREKD